MHLRVFQDRALGKLRAAYKTSMLRAVLPLRATWLARTRPRDPRRDKPHYLILRHEHYCDNIALGPSTEKFMIDHTLESSGLATAETLCWARGTQPYFPDGDRQLLDYCGSVRPDALLLSSYGANFRQAHVETLRVIRGRWGIPIVVLWWDTCHRAAWEPVRRALSFIDLHVITDNPRLTFVPEPPAGPSPERVLALWTPLDPHIFRNPGRLRDIPVAFLGQASGYRSERTAYLRFLAERGVDVSTSVREREDQPSHDEYANILQRARIGLNFSGSVDGPQFKARVLETISSGALLLEEDNPQTPCLLTPMHEYVPFHSPDDLVDKIRYYLAHEDERAIIAARAEARARLQYGPQSFWRQLIERLEAVTGRRTSTLHDHSHDSDAEPS